MTTTELIVSPSTAHPNSVWVAEQTESFLDLTSSRDEKPAIVMHDRDEIAVRTYVGGLVKSFEKKAA